jgi:hypothetical protein
MERSVKALIKTWLLAQEKGHWFALKGKEQ